MYLLAVAVLLLSSTLDEPTREAHTIKSGKEKLEAELVIPAQQTNKIPAVIFLVGSGAGNFRDYVPGFTTSLIEEVYLRRGIAVFYFNKRGVGESSGNWKSGSFETRTQDAIAAVKHLRALPIINPDQIGLIGHSQGGWIAQLVGVQDPRISFIVSLAGPVVSVREQDVRNTEWALKCEGYKGEELQKQVAKREKSLDRMSFWGRWLPFGELGFMARILSYDPRETVQKLTQPTLLAFAEHDFFVDASQNQIRLEELFPSGLPMHITTYTTPEADHMFRDTDTICFDWEKSLNAPYSDAFLSFLNQWLDSLEA